MHRLPTVRVHHPNDPDVMMIINESDLTDAHSLWDEPSVHPTELRVSKGPRGKWYVKQGKTLIAGPFDTEEDAEDAATRV